jgi:hypothetical protein
MSGPPVAQALAGVQQLAEFDLDLLRTKRLDEKPSDPRGLVRPHSMARCENYFEIRPKTFRLFGKLDAAQSWHDDIREQYVDMLLSEDAQGGGTILGWHNTKPLRG